MKEKNIKPEKKNSNLYNFENEIWQQNKTVCGVDEVGRGCLAGPIVTAALILHPHAIHPDIKDSKLLSSIQMEKIFTWLVKNSNYAIGISSPIIIDQKNIYATTQLTMKKALLHLMQSIDRKPDIIVIDAMPITLHNSPFVHIPIESWIKGESKSASIAAASIVAKVMRDRIMRTMHQAFPVYGLENHKGYGTKTHIAALKNVTESVIHRQTFIKNFKGSTHDASEQQSFC